MNYKEFVNEYLVPLTDERNPNRAALADLRRGLSDFPTLSPYMHRHILPHLPERVNEWGRLTYYLIGALFAAHQSNREDGNLGTHFYELLDLQNPDANTPIERRFTYLLAAHPEDLPFHLRQAVAFLRSKEIGINWVQLMWDVSGWNDPDRRPKIQERWASNFWQAQKKEDETLFTETEGA
jgi:CRISPR type I-E-associated protein CasB/Cse2